MGQRIIAWTRWALFVPLAAATTVIIFAFWSYLTHDSMLGRSYWEASTYYIFEPIFFVALGTWIAPSQRLEVPIVLSLLSALAFGFSEYPVISAVLHGSYSWHDREVASGIPLGATVWLTIVGLLGMIWYCFGKIIEVRTGSISIQYANLVACSIAFAFCTVCAFIATSVSTIDSDGLRVDGFGRVIVAAPGWCAFFGEGHMWYGLPWFFAERILFFGGILFLGSWHARLQNAETGRKDAADIKFSQSPQLSKADKLAESFSDSNTPNTDEIIALVSGALREAADAMVADGSAASWDQINGTDAAAYLQRHYSEQVTKEEEKMLSSPEFLENLLTVGCFNLEACMKEYSSIEYSDWLSHTQNSLSMIHASDAFWHKLFDLSRDEFIRHVCNDDDKARQEHIP